MPDIPDGRPARPGPGRPSKYTPDRIARIDQALRSGATRSAASAFGGIDENTFGRWMLRFGDFAELVRSAEAAAEIMHTASIAQAAQGIRNPDGTWEVRPDWRASAFWLERRRHDDWGRKDRIEIIEGVRKLAEAAGWDASEVAEAVRQAEALVRLK